MDLRKLTPDDGRVLAEMLSGHPSRPYRFLPGLPGDGVTGWWLDDFRSAAADPAGAVFAALDGGRPVAAAALAPLPWESDLLGRRMAVIRQLVLPPGRPHPTALADALLRQVEEFTAGQGAEFLLCKPYTSDIAAIHALERRGFWLMDTLLECVVDVRNSPALAAPEPLPPGLRLRLATAADAEPLREVARRSFREHFGRFHADDRIPAGMSLRVYEEWIVSCVRGWADWVVMAECDGRPAGYSAWKRPSAAEKTHGLPIGHYSIGAVDPDFFGRGVFSAITREGMRLFPGVADWVEGPTHLSNVPVQRGYLRLGWKLADARHSFHKWLGEEA
jgi:hypothetical protein